MNDHPTPEDILRYTTPQVKGLINEILKLEREYQNYQNLSAVREKENELCDRIVRLIEREIKQ